MNATKLKNCRLIVNADDFGESREINEGIVEAHTKGIVTSTSLMANMGGFEHALLCVKQNPTLDVGIHLNMHRGAPLTPCSYLTRKDKFLSNIFLFSFLVYLNRKRAHKEITAEFEAQIQKIIRTGVAISHLDTEKHLHTLPFVFNIVLTLAEKYRIPCVRLPFERVSMSTLLNPSQLYKSLIMNLYAPYNRHLLHSSTIKSTNYFYGVSLSKQFSLKHIQKVFATLPQGVSELSCHPGYEPEIAQNYIDAHRTEELKTLTHPDLQTYITKQGIVLSTFSDIR